jgi:hypothetical protein
MTMIDFANIALRTVMCLAFLAFVVRPLLMSMVRKEPNTLELEEMAQLAVNSAFRDQFANYYKPRRLEKPSDVPPKLDTAAQADSAQPSADALVVPLTDEELAALAQFDADEAERVRGHEEEMARRAVLAADAASRQSELDAQNLALEDLGEIEVGDDDSLKKMRENMKKEKKKPTIPTELLAGNSYDDKLMIVRYVTEQEQNRVANAIRSMIELK